MGSFTMRLVLLEHVQENVQDDGRGAPMILQSACSLSLEGLAVSSTAVPVPDSDAAGQHTLKWCPVDVVRVGGGRLALFRSAEKL